MKDILTLKQLDVVLEHLKKSHNKISDIKTETVICNDGKERLKTSNNISEQDYYIDIKDIHAAPFFHKYTTDFQNHELELLLLYLVEKNYVITGKTKQENVGYRISIKGLTFEGFVNERNYKLYKLWAYRANIFIVCAASIVATVYYIHEIIK